MFKHWKTVLALKVPTGEPDLDPLDIADRLDEIVSELAIVDAAIGSLEIEPRERCGFYTILTRQIDEIIAVRDTVHPPRR